MDQNPIRVAPEASTDERAPSSHAGGEAAGGADPLAFDPVQVSYRTDGWTPEKQAEFVEALADLGVVKWAAARVGMTEQSANRLRRRANARSFDLACSAAQRIGARRIVSLAFERAIEGRVKRHYFRGEIVGEERIHDSRLLAALLPRLLPLLEPSRETLAVERGWASFVDAIGRGEEPPLPAPAAPAVEPDVFEGSECWEDDDGVWWTEFPPPEAFDGIEHGRWGDFDYRRTFSAEEQTVIDEDRANSLAGARAARDRFFGFVPASEKVEVKGLARRLPRRTGCELSELCERSTSGSPPDGENRRRSRWRGRVAQRTQTAAAPRRPLAGRGAAADRPLPRPPRVL